MGSRSSRAGKKGAQGLQWLVVLCGLESQAVVTLTGGGVYLG